MSAPIAMSRATRGDLLNPRWILHTLRARGFPVATVRAIQSAIQEEKAENIAVIRSLVQRVAGGSETTEDSDFITSWISLAKRKFDTLPANEPLAREEQGPAREGVVVGCEETVAPTPRPRDFDRSHHVYATTGALCIEPVEVRTTREGQSDDVYHTLQIEMASNLSRGRFDWEHKIAFRLTRRELPLFVAAAMGFVPELEFGNHGPSADKWLTTREQRKEGTLFVRLKQRKRMVGVPIGAEEIFEVAAMGLKVIGKNAAHLDTQTVLHMVRRAASMYQAAKGAPT